MKTISISALLSMCLLLVGCSFTVDTLMSNEQINGKGEVITEQINLDSFSTLELKRGWEVTLQPASSNYMVIEANENLLEVFEYESQGENLVIGSSKQISKADAKRITLYYTGSLRSIKASSGTFVTSPELLKFEDLKLDLSSGSEVVLKLNLKSLDLETSSGADAELVLKSDEMFVDSSSGSYANINAETMFTTVETSSGAEVVLRGKSHQLEVQSSSGSSVNAREFRSDDVLTKASSGASIKAFSIKNLNAETSSGGSISYYNKPSGKLELNQSKSGGSIKEK